MSKMVVRETFSEELGKVVFLLEREDGSMLLPSEGIVSLGFDTEKDAEFCRDNNARLGGAK